jgi:Fic family protein
MPNPYLLIQPFLRREAVLSSRIEGTQASLSDLALFEAAAVPSRSGVPPDVVEVSNYVRALQWSLSADRRLPISLRLVRNLHEILMSGVRGEDQRPGEFRTIQNYIARPGTPMREASYVPPPPGTVLLDALQEFETFLHETSSLPPLVHLALSHYQFEAIHPFRDGNGRVGRLLVALLLVERKLISQPLLYLSAFFEAHRDEYYAGLSSVSRTGDWDNWIRFFLRAVAEQADDAIDRARSLVNLRDSYNRKLQAARTSALPLKLVDRLFESPIVTVAGAQRYLDVTHRAARLIIEKLVAHGILVAYEGEAPRNRPYFAEGILGLLQAELPARSGRSEPTQVTLELR